MKDFANHFLINKSFYRFIVVGISNTIISYLTFIIAYHFIVKSNTIISQILSYSAGIVWSFIWNRRWTFKSKKSMSKEFLLFVLTQVVMLVLSTALLYLIVDRYHYPASISWVCVMAIITILNFVMLKIVVFK